MKSRTERITAASPNAKVLAFVAGSSLLQSEDPARVLSSCLVRDHACKSCGTVVTASFNSTPEPFCVTCGHDELEPVSASYSAQPVIEGNSTLSGVNCSHCSFTTVVHASVLDAIGHDGSFCPSCGNSMYVTASVEPTTAENDMTTITNQQSAEVSSASETVQAGAANLQAGPAMEGEDPKIEKPTDDPGQPVGQPSMSINGPSPAEKDQPEVAATTCEDPVMSSSTDLASSQGSAGQPEMSEPGDISYVENFSQYRGVKPSIPGMSGGHFDMTDVSTSEDLRIVPKNDLHLSHKIEASTQKGIPAIDAFGLDDKVVGCSFVQIDDVLVAMKDHQSVATLSAKGARHNAGVMFTETFPGIVAEKMTKEGVRAALAHFGFDPILVPVKTNASYRAELNTATSAIREEYAAREAAMADSLAIAAVGLSRGTWRDTANPLMEGITDALTRAGVTNASRVSSSLMAKYGLEYSRTLASVASELSARSEESRKELASMHDLIDDKSLKEDVAPEVSTASLSFPSSVEGRLSQAAATPRQTPQVAALLRPGSTNAGLSQAALAILEGRAPLFNL